jgi:hypothetical protein
MIQIFFPIIVIGTMFWCPESPRWLVERNQIDRARGCLARVRSSEQVEQELEDIVMAVQYEKASEHNSGKWYAPCKCRFDKAGRQGLSQKISF